MLRVFAGRTSLKQRYKLEGTQEQGWQAQAPHKTKQSPACKGADTRRGGNSLEPTLTRSGYASLQRQHQRHSLKSHKHSQNGTYRVLMCLHRPLIQLSLRRFARRQACGKRVPGQRARRGCCANAVLSMSADLHANPAKSKPHGGIVTAQRLRVFTHHFTNVQRGWSAGSGHVERLGERCAVCLHAALLSCCVGTACVCLCEPHCAATRCKKLLYFTCPPHAEDKAASVCHSLPCVLPSPVSLQRDCANLVQALPYEDTGYAARKPGPLFLRQNSPKPQFARALAKTHQWLLN